MLYLVRHGRTAANASGLLQGRLDPPLDEIGCKQAVAIAALVGPVDAVITSSLVRARETAQCFGLPVEVDDRWIELAYGEYEGVPAAEVPNEVWQAWRTDAKFATEGGECFGALDARVRSACDELAARIGREDVVVVSHVSPIKAAVAWALGVGPETSWRMFLDVAAICRIGVSGRGASLLSYNSVAHLGGVASTP